MASVIDPRCYRAATNIATLSGQGYAYVQLIDYDQEFKSYALADITIYNEAGDICAVVSGFKAIASSLNEGQAATVSPQIAQFNTSSKPVIAATTNRGAVDQGLLSSKSMQYVTQAFTKATGIEPAKIKSDRAFESMGIDSITMVKLNKIFENDFAELSKTVFFECNTTSKVKDYLIDNHFDELLASCGLGAEEGDASTNAVGSEFSEQNEFNSASDEINDDSQSKDVTTELDTNVYIAPRRFTFPTEFEETSTRLENSIVVLMSNDTLPEVDGIKSVVVKYGKVYRQLKDPTKFIVRKDNPKDFLKLVSTLLKNNLVPDVFAIFEGSRLDLNMQIESSDFSQILVQSVDFLQNMIKGLTQTFPQLNARIIHFHQGTLHNAQPQWEAYTGLSNSLLDVNNKLFMLNVAIDPVGKERSNV